ncbi:cilia- and flagella-associated protein 144 isoform X4 [Meriones unguiculatus]|uniref:cilia- and flagella-associated protein 144 isoform X4 n=1 Tax=Meriones unguiculatus TaxID=10047 RepID=UPI00293EB59F|nr:cilia- and flagella-associated protein 144 isoform X4 [Meriones unguiculatus]
MSVSQYRPPDHMNQESWGRQNDIGNEQEHLCPSMLFWKIHPITRKPMSWHDNLEEPADVKFLNVIHHAAHGPRMKYSETQTEAQEIGWNPRPLINPDRQDKRLNHFKVYRDITLYKAKLWRLGEENYLK